MTHQLVTDRSPARSFDPVARSRTESPTLARVTDQVGHPRTQGGQVPRRIEPAGTAVVHQLERAAASDRDDRHAGGHRFLDRLAEGLGLPGVDEDVQPSHQGRELGTAQETGEDGIRQHRLEPVGLRAVAGDHQPGVGEVCQHSQVVDLLLGSQPADVADDHLAVRGDLSTPVLVTVRRLEPLCVHTPAPTTNARDAALLQFTDAERRRRQRQGGTVVNVEDPLPQHRFRRRDPVASRVRRHLGLVDRNTRQPEPFGCDDRPPAQHERRGQVDHVGLDLGQQPTEPGAAADRNPE